MTPLGAKTLKEIDAARGGTLWVCEFLKPGERPKGFEGGPGGVV